VERRRPIKATDPNNRKSTTLEMLANNSNRATTLKAMLEQTQTSPSSLRNESKRQSVMLLEGSNRSDNIARLFGGSSKFVKEEAERIQADRERKKKEAEQKRLMEEEDARWQAERLAKEAKGYGSDEEWSDSDGDDEPPEEDDEEEEEEDEDESSEGMAFRCCMMSGDTDTDTVVLCSNRLTEEYDSDEYVQASDDDDSD
jgi:hypothetical protein